MYTMKEKLVYLKDSIEHWRNDSTPFKSNFVKNNITKLHRLLHEYNNKNIHSTIKMTPLQATDPNNVN